MKGCDIMCYTSQLPTLAADIIEYIHDFENSLDENHTAVISVSSIVITSVSFRKTGLICFYGTCNGQPAQVIQSINNINFQLHSIELNKDEPKIKIGFM